MQNLIGPFRNQKICIIFSFEKLNFESKKEFFFADFSGYFALQIRIKGASLEDPDPKHCLKALNLNTIGLSINSVREQLTIFFQVDCLLFFNGKF